MQSRGEKYQAEGRPLVKLTDEGHLITTNELLGPKLAKATKMWRKLSIWFWLATQNLRDFLTPWNACSPCANSGCC